MRWKYLLLKEVFIQAGSLTYDLILVIIGVPPGILYARVRVNYKVVFC